MAPKPTKSDLKRARHSTGDGHDAKKPRRSERLSQTPQTNQAQQAQQAAHRTTAKSNGKPDGKAPKTPIKSAYLPSPLTHNDSTVTNTSNREGTATPEEGRPSQLNQMNQQTPQSSPLLQGLSSPPQDTQVLSQFVYPPRDLGDELEEEEDTWGYLIPVDPKVGERLVLRTRSFCPAPARPLEIKRDKKRTKTVHDREELKENEEKYEDKKIEDDNAFPAGGYLIGRHPECDMQIDINTISNRHCLVFNENKIEGTVAVVEDLSSNGTFVNEVMLGRNKRRELEDGDEIAIIDSARFVFKYSKSRQSSAFHSQYRILQQLGKGHFATVYLCVERSTGFKFAVKKFERRMGDSQKSQTEGLQQEIAVLMSVSHPNVLCLKDTFEEADGVYLILELASEGELFNCIVSRQKLTEAETRKVFIQLFQGIKYLHERNIVHRDIKPENILLTDKNLSVKIADFGLAKMIGEQSFTTTLCGTPSYVAPEILENTKHRKYTRAVDVWSLGVVLYICLCGFPPFSDELKPYTLAQQIKMGHFDYPSPYWDSVGDPALDLIDKMLTVKVEDRITIDECLEHPWTRNISMEELRDPRNGYVNPSDSTDGLTGAIGGLKMDFSKRKIKRQRTLLADVNDIKVSKVVKTPGNTIPGHKNGEMAKVKVWEKNVDGKQRAVDEKGTPGNKTGGASQAVPQKKDHKQEDRPAEHRQQEEFMNMGGRGDMQLFTEDNSSRYNKQEVP